MSRRFHYLILACSLASIAPAFAQQPAPEPAAAPTAPSVPAPEQALEELVRALEDDRPADALAGVAELEQAFAANSMPAAEWGEGELALLAYSAGLAGARRADQLLATEGFDPAEVLALENAAVQRFARARELAGPSELRLRASYAPGALLCARGERMLRVAASQAALARQQRGDGAPSFAQKSPERQLLDESARVFESARDALLERLRIDWRDVDTRANLEWVRRRLAEIDRIRERADAEPPQEPPEQPDQQGERDEQDQPDRPDQSDPSQDEQSGDDATSEEGSDEAEPQPGEDGDASNEPTGSESEQDDSSTEAGAEDGANRDAPETHPSSEDGTPPTPGASEEAEAVTGEFPPMGELEVQRLLQRLAEIEQTAAETRARLRSKQRRRVERDW